MTFSIALSGITFGFATQPLPECPSWGARVFCCELWTDAVSTRSSCSDWTVPMLDRDVCSLRMAVGA